MSLSARLFDRGPFIYSGDSSADAGSIFVTGRLDPGQAGCSYAFAVPYVDDGDRLIPARPDGQPAPVGEVVESLTVELDHALAFKLKTSRSLWSDRVHGVLFAVLYDLDLGGPIWHQLHELLHGWEKRTAAIVESAALLSELPPEVVQALEALFNKRAAQLRSGTLTNAAAESAARRATRSAGRAPAPGPQSKTTFALASCQYPAGMLDDVPAQASYRRLASWLKGAAGTGGEAEFVLLVGDQVYTDATAGLFDPSALFDRFEQPHDAFLKLLTDVGIGSGPLYMMLDDHEIEDNWELPAGGLADPLLVAGREHYKMLRRLFGPKLRDPVGDYKNPLWYIPEGLVFPLFVADTRTERDRRTAATIGAARIMRREQFDALCDWLSEQRRNDPDLPKFVATPSILLPRRLRAARDHPAAALRSDAWDGYPGSLHALLAHIAENDIRNVVFLSGDEHLSCVAKIDITAPRKEPIRIVSVHSSALYAPFPFANSAEADLKADFEGKDPEGKDQFTFLHPQRGWYRCELKTRFMPGDGFAVIRVAHDGKSWIVDCQFERGEDKREVLPVLP